MANTEKTEKQLVMHKKLFLGGNVFSCGCGSHLGTKHVLVFSDGSVTEECDSCFLNDVDAINNGLLDDPASFVIDAQKKSTKHKNSSDFKFFGYVFDYNSF